jgi:hypothetical protein
MTGWSGPRLLLVLALVASCKLTPRPVRPVGPCDVPAQDGARRLGLPPGEQPVLETVDLGKQGLAVAVSAASRCTALGCSRLLYRDHVAGCPRFAGAVFGEAPEALPSAQQWPPNLRTRERPEAVDSVSTTYLEHEYRFVADDRAWHDARVRTCEGAVCGPWRAPAEDHTAKFRP